MGAGASWHRAVGGDPLARGASRPLKGGEWPNLISKEPVVRGRLVRPLPAFLFLKASYLPKLTRHRANQHTTFPLLETL